MSNRIVEFRIPDNFVNLTKDEIDMLSHLVDIKSGYATEKELEILNDLENKLNSAKQYYDEIDRAMSGLL